MATAPVLEHAQQAKQAVSLFAVVATDRPLEATQAAIHALLRQTRPPDGVILVDNSDDGHFRDAFPDGVIEIVSTGRNTGAAGGFGIGADLALERGASHVIFVDDDCALEPQALERLEVRMRESLRGAVVGPAVIAPGTEDLVWPMVRPDGRLYERLSELPEHPIPTRHLAFHGLTVSAEALRAAGGPRKDLFFGGPDVEFCLRLAAHGYGIFYCPEVVARHHEVYYRRFWFLGRRKVPTGTPGHRYYVLRNRLLMWRLYRRDPFVIGVGKEILREFVGAMLSGRRLVRLGLLAVAAKEGLTGDPHRTLNNAVPLDR